MRMKVRTIKIADQKGYSWYVRVSDDEKYIRQLYTQPLNIIEEDVPTEIKISSLDGEIFKLKIGTNGQLYTYPVDSLN